ncbi:MAG: hypothetical protein HKP61_18975, partial [Dactylosporangium sp.]|nr:hypothetical protein [Dactylosporangium sp.]NNJ62973.1 hypothetical protein [Dactylosporangium sp.]
GPGGALFLGLAPQPAAHRYLAGTTHATVDRVRAARGRWPVDLNEVAGPATPAGTPFAQTFWIATSSGLTRDGKVEDALAWTPSAVRGQHMALVVMNADASLGLDVHLAAALTPGWLMPMMWGLLVVGSTLLLLGVVLVAWPALPRKVIYVLDDAGTPLLTARLRGRSATPVQVDSPPASPAEVVAGRPAGMRDAAGAGASGGCRAASTGRPHINGNSRFDGVARRGGDNQVNGGRARVSAGHTEPRTWAALLASARPPATPRLLWPPKRADRPTSPPVPTLPSTASSGPSPRPVSEVAEADTVGLLD